MRTVLKHWLLNSGSGGVAAFDSPAPLLLAPISAERIDVYWMDVGQDNNKLYINTVDDFETATEVYDGAGFTKSNTGLTRGQTYYFWLVVSESGVESATLTGSASTCPLDILAWFEFSGLKIGTSNDFGALTSGSVDTFKSVFSTTKTATAIGSKYVLKPTHPKFPYHRIGQTTHTGYSLDTPITMSGDFTVIAPKITVATLGSSNRFLNVNTAGNISLQLIVNTTQTRVRFYKDPTFYDVVFTVTNTVGDVISPGWRRDGSTFYATLDGGQTWTAYGSAVPTDDVVADKLFIGHANANPFWHDFGPRLVYLNGADQTAQQLSDWVLDYFQTAEYSPDSVGSSEVLTTKGLDYSVLIDGHLADTMSFDINSGNKNFDRLKSCGNLHFFALNTKASSPDYSDGLIAVYDSNTKKISEQINVGRYIDNTDTHANHSVDIYDRTVDYFRPSVWYGLESNSSTFKRKSSGKNFNFTEINERKYTKGLDVVVGHHSAYYQIESNGLSPTRVLFAQENGKETGEQLGQYITSFLSTDNFQNFQKIRIMNSEGTVSNIYWLYHRVCEMDGGIGVFWRFWNSGITKIKASGFVKTTDGITYSNNSGSWTKNTLTSGPMTLTELLANTVIIDAVALAGEGDFLSVSVDENGIAYGVFQNGTDNGYNLWYNGTTKAIDFGGLTVDYDWRNQPLEVVKTGASEYHIFLTDTAEANARVAHIKTVNGGDDWSFVEFVNDDSSIDYGQIFLTKNHHFNRDAILSVAVPTTGFNNKMSITEIKLNGSYTI